MRHGQFKRRMAPGGLRPHHLRLCDRLNALARTHRETLSDLRGFRLLKVRWRESFREVRRK